MIAPDLRPLAFPVEKLQEMEGNPRLGNVDAVAKSYERFGQQKPIVARHKPDGTGEVIAGNHQLKAARQLGWKELAVVWADDLSDEDARGFALADNRSADLGTYDDDLLAQMLSYVADDADLLAATSYSQKDIDKLIGVPEPPEDVDDIPQPPGVPVTVAGDVWVLGRHRVACGDATDPATIRALVGGRTVDAIVTDPPYGVGVDYESFQDTKENVAGLISAIMPLLLSAPCAVLTPGVPSAWLYPQPAWLLAWIHPAPSGRCPWGFAGVNPILAYGKDPYLVAGKGGRPDSLVSASDRQGVDGHPTPKPMNVWEWLVERVSPLGSEVILDPFGGSGTTIIAAERLGRTALVVELAPRYVDVICRRFQNLTGVVPVLESTGEAHDFGDD